MLKKIEVTIQGQSPLLMHAFPMEPAPEGSAKWSPEKIVKLAEYRDKEGKLYVPGIAIQRCLINGGKFSKGKGRATLQKTVAACVMITPEYVYLNQDDYIIDARPVVVPATKGRIIRYRPRFDEWELTFTIEYDDALLSNEELRKIVDNSGQGVGLLDFRPQCNGSFGRFVVNKWEEI